MVGDYDSLKGSHELLVMVMTLVRLCAMLSPLFCMIKKLEGV